MRGEWGGHRRVNEHVIEEDEDGLAGVAAVDCIARAFRFESRNGRQGVIHHATQKRGNDSNRSGHCAQAESANASLGLFQHKLMVSGCSCRALQAVEAGRLLSHDGRAPGGS